MRFLDFSFLLISLLLVCHYSTAKYTPCDPHDFGHGSVVCKCSKNYCDGFTEQSFMNLKDGEYEVFTSSKDGDRFKEDSGKMSPETETNGVGSVTFKVDSNQTYQTIVGFGGAFTDIASWHLYNMSQMGLRDLALKAYFSPVTGLGFTLTRVPMASNDFSSRVYSYDDVEGDLALDHFALALEDTEYKIPAIQEAMRYAGNQLKVFASAWSAPGWMKIDGKMIWGGKLLGKAGGKYHQAWAKYFVKFIDAYKAQGIPIWGVTAENEPVEGLVPGYPFQSMGFTAAMERDFIKIDLGPTLAKSHKDVKIMMLDDQRIFLEPWADTILTDPEAKKYVSGIALHWYIDKMLPPAPLTRVHDRFPDVFLLGSEACGGFIFPPRGVLLGSWERGEDYSTDILQDINNWSVGWVAWNLVLDLKGGPSWLGNKADSSIIIDYSNGMFYKQPTFYHFGHISRFVPPGSKRISITTNSSTDLHYSAFLTPMKTIVVVLLNKSEEEETGNICETNLKCIKFTIKARAIQTYQWRE